MRTKAWDYGCTWVCKTIYIVCKDEKYSHQIDDYSNAYIGSFWYHFATDTLKTKFQDSAVEHEKNNWVPDLWKAVFQQKEM